MTTELDLLLFLLHHSTSINSLNLCNVIYYDIMLGKNTRVIHVSKIYYLSYIEPIILIKKKFLQLHV